MAYGEVSKGEQIMDGLTGICLSLVALGAVYSGYKTLVDVWHPGVKPSGVVLKTESLELNSLDVVDTAQPGKQPDAVVVIPTNVTLQIQAAQSQMDLK